MTPSPSATRPSHGLPSGGSRWVAFGFFLFAVIQGTSPSIAQTESPFGPHCNDSPGMSDTGDLIKNGDNAIEIAFALMRARNPDIQVTDEKTWAENFGATLDKKACVWEVAEKAIPPRHYSTVIIGIGAQDGRFLGILVSD